MRKFLAFCLGLACLFACACAKGNGEEYVVYAPDGAPALALSKAFALDTETDGVTYRVVDGSAIGAYVTYENPAQNADACILPFNLATKALGSGERYQMAGVVTHGNLYLMSAENTPLQSPSELLGKTVRIAQLAAVPGLVMKMVLAESAIPYQSANDGGVAADKVNLTASGQADFWLADSLQGEGENAYAVADLQAWYGGENGYPQAVLVVKKSRLNDGRTAALIAAIDGAAGYLAAADYGKVCADVQARMAAGKQSKITEKTLNAATVTRSAIRWQPSPDCRAETDAFLEKASKIAPALVGAVENAFYGGN